MVSALGISAIKTEPLPLWRRLMPWALAVAFVILALLTTDLGAVRSHLAQVNGPLYILFFAVFISATLSLDSLATWRTYRSVAPNLGYWELLSVRGAAYLPAIANYHIGQAYLTYLISKHHRVPLLRVGGATLLVYASVLGALVALAGISLPFGVARMPWATRLVVGCWGVGLVYLGVLVLRPRFLTQRQALKPLFDTGVWGHVKLLAWRIPHVTVLLLGQWVAYRFCGVNIPFTAALVTMPLLLLVASLPLTPNGVGTRDLVAVALLTRFVVGVADQRAPIVAAGTLWVLVSSIGQALVGLLFARKAAEILSQERPATNQPLHADAE